MKKLMKACSDVPLWWYAHLRGREIQIKVIHTMSQCLHSLDNKQTNGIECNQLSLVFLLKYLPSEFRLTRKAPFPSLANYLAPIKNIEGVSYGQLVRSIS